MSEKKLVLPEVPFEAFIDRFPEVELPFYTIDRYTFRNRKSESAAYRDDDSATYYAL